MAVMRYHSPRKLDADAGNTAATPNSKGASPRNYGLTSPYAHDEDQGEARTMTSPRRLTSAPTMGLSSMGTGGFFSRQTSDAPRSLQRSTASRPGSAPNVKRQSSAPNVASKVKAGVRSEAIVESVLKSKNLGRAAGVKSEVLTSHTMRYHLEGVYESNTPRGTSALDLQNPQALRENLFSKYKPQSSSVDRIMERPVPPPLDTTSDAAVTPQNLRMPITARREATDLQLDALLSARGDPRPKR